MDIAWVMELLYKQFNVDKNHFPQVIGDGVCYVSSISHFLFGYNARSLFISVSENFYEKFIVNQDYCVSNLSSFCPKENCNFHSVSIVSSLDQILRRLDKNHFTYQFVCKNHNYFFLS